MMDEEQLRNDEAIRYWLGFLFRSNPLGFEYFGMDLDGIVFSHEKLGRISFAGDWALRYHYDGLARVIDETPRYYHGFNSWQYNAFREGFNGKKKPRIWHTKKRHFWYLGKKANPKFH